MSTPNQNALLFSLQFGLGRRSQQDQETTKETEARKNAEDGACAVRVNFFPKGAFKPLLEIQRKWKEEIQDFTLPTLKPAMDTPIRLLAFVRRTKAQRPARASVRRSW